MQRKKAIAGIFGVSVLAVLVALVGITKDPTKCNMIIKNDPERAYQPAAYTIFGYVVSECIDFGVELPVRQDAQTRQLFIQDERGNKWYLTPNDAAQAGKE